MTPRYEIRVSRRATRDIERAREWWSRHREQASRAVAEEIERAFQLLEVHPGVGTIVLGTRITGVRRLHLDRVHYYLYYRITGETVDVLALWHTSRGTEPRV